MARGYATTNALDQDRKTNVAALVWHPILQVPTNGVVTHTIACGYSDRGAGIENPAYTLVALNFTAEPKWAPFWFPVDGRYREELHGELDPGLDLHGVEALVPRDLWIPSNYGRVWTRA